MSKPIQELIAEEYQFLRGIGISKPVRDCGLGEVSYVLDVVRSMPGESALTPNMARWVFNHGYDWREIVKGGPDLYLEARVHLDCLARLEEIGRGKR